MTGEYQGPLPGPPPGPPPASNQLSGNEVAHMASTSTAPTSRPVPETPPAYPPRPAQSAQPDFYLPGKSQAHFAPPPKRRISYVGDSASPVHYIRDPHKLIAYLVPFPKPDIRKGFLYKADGADRDVATAIDIAMLLW